MDHPGAGGDAGPHAVEIDRGHIMWGDRDSPGWWMAFGFFLAMAIFWTGLLTLLYPLVTRSRGVGEVMIAGLMSAEPRWTQRQAATSRARSTRKSSTT